MFLDAENSNINTTPVETNYENGATTHSTAATIKWDELNGLDYQKFRVVAEPIDNTNVCLLQFLIISCNKFSYSTFNC